MSGPRCEYCGTNLDEEAASIDQYARSHTVDRCREYLKAALIGAERECARLRTKATSKLRCDYTSGHRCQGVIDHEGCHHFESPYDVPEEWRRLHPEELDR